MRIFPLILIAIGAYGLLKHFGLVDAAFLHLLWPVLLIGIGVALLARGRHWRAEVRERRHERWERDMHRHFGPGWANLSEAERERFRAGMRQWHGHADGDGRRDPSSAPPSNDGESSKSSNPGRAPGEPR